MVSEFDVAVIGIGCRFPQSNHANAFWENLMAGHCAVVDLSEEELTEAGVDPALLAAKHYVKRAGVLENADCFDADYFGFSPREAELLDPQHRLFSNAQPMHWSPRFTILKPMQAELAALQVRA
ncbi:MAG: hypothetical protein HC848_00150 [Limnobacter sp.]|nr:hypothetical protein [Limnobacter sp.]